MEAKKLLRIEMLNKRKQHTSEEIAQISKLVVRNLWSMPEISKANLLMGYLSFGREISLDAFIERALAMGKRICVPRIYDAQQSIIKPNWLDDITAVEHAELGIRIPSKISYAQPDDIDVVLVPGVAFSLSGQRLGMGKGYYDRFLPTTKALRVGICAEYNLLDSVPTDEYDALVDYLVTPDRVIKITGTATL